MVVADRLSHALGSRGADPVTRGAGRRQQPFEMERGPSAATCRRGPQGPAPDWLASPPCGSRSVVSPAGPIWTPLMVTHRFGVRRWPDRGREAAQGLPDRRRTPGYQPRMAGFVRDGLFRWENVGMGVRFMPVSDTTGADIVVRWIDRFDFDRAGQTDLTWDQAGRVRKAVDLPRLRTNAGVFPARRCPRLGCSARNRPRARPAAFGRLERCDVPGDPDRQSLSERDRRTAQVLYQLPPGPVRDPSGHRHDAGAEVASSAFCWPSLCSRPRSGVRRLPSPSRRRGCDCSAGNQAGDLSRGGRGHRPEGFGAVRARLWPLHLEPLLSGSDSRLDPLGHRLDHQGHGHHQCSHAAGGSGVSCDWMPRSASTCPGSRGPAKDRVTVRMLLDHTSGLRSYVPFFKQARTREAAIALLYSESRSGSRVNGRSIAISTPSCWACVLESVSGMPLERLVAQEVFAAAGA